MQHDWILDVLTDLRSYAQKNALVALAAKVDDALLTARAELSDLSEAVEGRSDGLARPSGSRRAH